MMRREICCMGRWTLPTGSPVRVFLAWAYTSIDPVMECNVGGRYFLEILKECCSSSLDKDLTVYVERHHRSRGMSEEGGEEDMTMTRRQQSVVWWSKEAIEGEMETGMQPLGGMAALGALSASGSRAERNKTSGRESEGREHTSTCLLGSARYKYKPSAMRRAESSETAGIVHVMPVGTAGSLGRFWGGFRYWYGGRRAAQPAPPILTCAARRRPSPLHRRARTYQETLVFGRRLWCGCVVGVSVSPFCSKVT